MALTPSVLMDDAAIFRRFNRMYTRFIGMLNEGLLNSPYSLAEARVLYELATRDVPKAREIAEELGMDAGYLSRLLGKFERDELLKRKASEQDRRYAELTLTARGRAAFRKLNALSEEKAQTVLEGLAPSARMQLIDCMRTVEGLLTKADRRRLPYILRPHRVGDMGWIVHREGVGYAEQYGWDETFEALVARIVDQFITNFDPGRERCWIAEIDGQSVGHIFLVKHPEEADTAKLRLLFVEPSARGIGLGDALVKECVHFARTAGYTKVVLWTQSILVGAHRIYERAGFRLVSEVRHRSFGKDLVGQTWELVLK
ncbi:MAG TPA: helix-turn-helix domain-containing GNAT family N-acetyltransferase [Edaphobacter sp.]|nr:helix-turn-helix domain-containing GNAT family N-acetyltransferase [Edaphobacter sp.]